MSEHARRKRLIDPTASGSFANVFNRFQNPLIGALVEKFVRRGDDPQEAIDPFSKRKKRAVKIKKKTRKPRRSKETTFMEFVS